MEHQRNLPHHDIIEQTIAEIAANRQIIKERVEANNINETVQFEETKRTFLPVTTKLTEVVETVKKQKPPKNMSITYTVMNPKMGQLIPEETSDGTETSTDASPGYDVYDDYPRGRLPNPILSKYGFPSFDHLTNKSRTECENILIATKARLKSLHGQGGKRVKNKSEQQKQTIRGDIEELGKYKSSIESFLSTQFGGRLGGYTGRLGVYTNIDQIVRRLQLLCGEIKAGNNSPEVWNEFVDVIDYLLEQKVITKHQYEVLSKIYSS